MCNCEHMEYAIINGRVREVEFVDILSTEGDDDRTVYSYEDNNGLTQQTSFWDDKKRVFNCYASAHSSLVNKNNIEELRLKLKALEDRLEDDVAVEDEEVERDCVIDLKFDTKAFHETIEKFRMERKKCNRPSLWRRLF